MPRTWPNLDVETLGEDISEIGKKGTAFKKVVERGGGDTPGEQNEVHIHYKAYVLLHDGRKEFDSSGDFKKPLKFKLGGDSSSSCNLRIPGWDVGVATMRSGEKALFTFAPELGYGDRGNPPMVHPNAWLQYEIELVTHTGEDLSEKRDGQCIKYLLSKGQSGVRPPRDRCRMTLHLLCWHKEEEVADENLEFTFRCDVFSERNDDIPEEHPRWICRGVQKVIRNMTVGEVCHVEVSPEYGFGSHGYSAYNIPPDAHLKFQLTMMNYQQIRYIHELTFQERISEAQKVKEEGNAFYNEKRQFDKSIKLYRRVIDLTEGDAQFPEDERKKLEQMRLTGHLNTAACYLKKKDYREAIKSCEMALLIDKHNVKALYRRAEAYIRTSRPEECLTDLKRLLRFDPVNAHAKQLLVDAEMQVRELKERNRAAYNSKFVFAAD